MYIKTNLFPFMEGGAQMVLQGMGAQMLLEGGTDGVEGGGTDGVVDKHSLHLCDVGLIHRLAMSGGSSLLCIFLWPHFSGSLLWCILTTALGQ